MERLLPILILFYGCLGLFSCKKQDQPDAGLTAKSYKVSFSVAGGNSLKTGGSGNPLRINDAGMPTLASQFAVLVYNIFDAKNNQVRQLTQYSANANFGIINDSLPSGTYTAVIAAGQAGMFEKTVSTATGPAGYVTYCAYLRNNMIGPFYDTFYKKITFTVANSAVSQIVNLERIDAELEVRINDALPANADHITYSFDNEYLAFDLLNGQPIPSSLYVSYTYPPPGTTGPIPASATAYETVSVPASAAGAAGFTFDNIVLNTSGMHTVTITCYDAQSNALQTKSVSNVTFQANTKTILAGNLFGSSNQSEINVTTAWGSTNTVGF